MGDIILDAQFFLFLNFCSVCILVLIEMGSIEVLYALLHNTCVDTLYMRLSYLYGNANVPVGETMELKACVLDAMKMEGIVDLTLRPKLFPQAQLSSNKAKNIKLKVHSNP